MRQYTSCNCQPESRGMSERVDQLRNTPIPVGLQRVEDIKILMAKRFRLENVASGYWTPVCTSVLAPRRNQ